MKKTGKCIGLTIVGVTALTAAPGSPWAGRPHVAADLAHVSDSARVIVTYRAEVGSDELQQIAQRSPGLGTRLEGIHGLAGRLSAGEIEALKRDERVLSLSPDREVAG